MIRTLDELPPASRAAADRYVDSVAATAPAHLRGEVRADVTADLCARLEAGCTPEQIDRVIAPLRPMGGDIDDGPASEGSAARRWANRLTAGLAPRGVPARIARTWWNPTDRRLFVPRAVGIGWDLNAGAVAVRLGLIEPDAEAVPFTATPDRAFALAAALPTALSAATALHYVVRGRGLPEQLPDHWDLLGRPDRWIPKRRAAITDLGIAAACAALALWAALPRGAAADSGPRRAGALAGATLIGSLGATTTVLRSLGDRSRGIAEPALLASATGAVGAVLLGLARAGRAAEIDRDLAATRDA